MARLSDAHTLYLDQFRFETMPMDISYISVPVWALKTNIPSRCVRIKRKVDPDDRRSVLIQRTVPGSVFLSEFADLMQRVNWDYAAERGDPFRRSG